VYLSESDCAAQVHYFLLIFVSSSLPLCLTGSHLWDGAGRAIGRQGRGLIVGRQLIRIGRHLIGRINRLRIHIVLDLAAAAATVFHWTTAAVAAQLFLCCGSLVLLCRWGWSLDSTASTATTCCCCCCRIVSVPHDIYCCCFSSWSHLPPCLTLGHGPGSRWSVGEVLPKQCQPVVAVRSVAPVAHGTTRRFCLFFLFYFSRV
jgi:hypothetical protein